jgi:hypothetical protein
MLLIAEKWVNSKVENPVSRCGTTQEGCRRLPGLTVTRGVDGIIIPVRSNDGHMLHLIAETTGDEMVYVTDIFEREGVVIIQYLPVHDTQHAYASCDREEDLIETLNAENRSIVQTKRIGKKSLRALIQSKGNVLHHWGDFAWETRAEHIVGLVGWLSVGDADDPNAKAKALNIMKSKGLGGIKSPEDVDWVIVGEQFSDTHPDNKQPQEPTEILESSIRERRTRSTRAKTKVARTTPATTASGDFPTLKIIGIADYA